MAEGWSVAVGRLHNGVVYPINETMEEELIAQLGFDVSKNHRTNEMYEYCLYTEEKMNKFKTNLGSEYTLDPSFNEKMVE